VDLVEFAGLLNASPAFDQGVEEEQQQQQAGGRVVEQPPLAGTIPCRGVVVQAFEQGGAVLEVLEPVEILG